MLIVAITSSLAGTTTILSLDATTSGTIAIVPTEPEKGDYFTFTTNVTQQTGDSKVGMRFQGALSASEYIKVTLPDEYTLTTGDEIIVTHYQSGTKSPNNTYGTVISMTTSTEEEDIHKYGIPTSQKKDADDITYTVTASDEFNGEKTFYVRSFSPASDKSTYVQKIRIVRTTADTKVATPTCTLGAWDAVNGKYAVTLNCTTAGHTIKYSTDNKESYSDYSTALALAPGTTLDAYAVKGGLEDSDNMAQYTVPAAPVITPYATPTITEINGTVQITTTDEVAGMQIKYSIDGGTSYSTYSIPFNITSATTVKAYVTGSDASYSDSEIAEQACSAIPSAKTGSKSITLFYSTDNFTLSRSIPEGEGGKNDTMTGKADTDYEGWIVALDNEGQTGSNIKELSSGNNINSKKTFKGSNGRKITFTLPDGLKANRITLYSYTNGSGDNESYWCIDSETKTSAISLSKQNECTASKPDVRVYTLSDKNSFYIKNGGYQQCFYIVVDYTETETITLGANGYSTFAGEKNFTVTGATAYTAEASASKVTLTECAANAVIAAGKGIVLKGTEGAEVTITYSTDEVTVTSTGLEGVISSTTTISENPYVLASNGTKTAFVKAGTYGTVSALMNKAYLNGAALSLNSLDIEFKGDPTAIENIAETKANAEVPVKVIKNGKLYIGNYNVAGQLVK